MKPKLNFHILSKEQVDQLERTPHNPPIYSETFSPDDFSREWWSVHNALQQRLSIFGDEGESSSVWGDYALSESRGESRWIYITFVSTKLWRPEFVVAVAELLRSLPLDYRIGCVTELNDEEFLVRPFVYLVISSEDVFGCAQRGRFTDSGVTWMNCSDKLRQFGFPP